MKNFLKEFFRPLDNIIFNYLVKIGAIKCIDPVTAIGIGGQILGGIFGSRSARKAARQRAEAIRNAYAQFRDPTVLIREQYGGRGIYSPAAMQTILRREGYNGAYEKLKTLTRKKKKINKTLILEFINSLDISSKVKSDLKKITPFNYVGI